MYFEKRKPQLRDATQNMHFFKVDFTPLYDQLMRAFLLAYLSIVLKIIINENIIHHKEI